jgi:hypothetical protein
MISPAWTAFDGDRQLASGAPPDVARAVKTAIDADAARPILVFDDLTGRTVDIDLRGSAEEVAARLRSGEDNGPRPAGRPKLGVVAREVTLLPRHWDWLASQSGGASVALRKLVDAARMASGDDGIVRQAQEAADRFMSAALGNQPGYEEAARALYAGDRAGFERLAAIWPRDLAAHALRLAGPALGAVA